MISPKPSPLGSISLEEGEIPLPSLSFAAIVKGQSKSKTSEEFIANHPVVTEFTCKPITIYQGKPSIAFHTSDISKLLVK
ncbi:hypothetical protein LIER_34241 [Lithospermum erythrorhizon]|uniref:Uncharacterized protein n=1 Tax=Lithospermum erythrorhizon TaxID=34254 RepID=A0AAV3S0U2_LITER